MILFVSLNNYLFDVTIYKQSTGLRYNWSFWLKFCKDCLSKLAFVLLDEVNYISEGANLILFLSLARYYLKIIS